MPFSLSAAAAAVLLVSAVTAAATEPPPRVGERDPRAATAGQVQDPKQKPAKAPSKPPTRRRSVQMTVDGMPASAPPAVYAPTLTPRPAPSPIVTSPSVGLAPPAPVIMNSCDGGGCFGTDGKRYNGAVGNVLIGPQGRMCTNNGITVQC